MKTLAGSLIAVLFSVSVSVGAQSGRTELNYCEDVTANDFRAAAKWSFINRNYQIEEDTPSSITGGQRGKKVEIAMMDSGRIVIRWVPGFAYSKDDWLVNLKQDMLQKLAGEAEKGKWTINWCKDLTVDEFYAAAKWSLQKRKYQIEEDTPSSLTGEQKGKKVQITMTDPGRIVIRWVPGFGYGSDGWLDRLYRDVIGRLAE